MLFTANAHWNLVFSTSSWKSPKWQNRPEGGGNAWSGAGGPPALRTPRGRERQNACRLLKVAPSLSKKARTRSRRCRIPEDVRQWKHSGIGLHFSVQVQKGLLQCRGNLRLTTAFHLTWSTQQGWACLWLQWDWGSGSVARESRLFSVSLAKYGFFSVCLCKAYSVFQ